MNIRLVPAFHLEFRAPLSIHPAGAVITGLRRREVYVRQLIRCNRVSVTPLVVSQSSNCGPRGHYSETSQARRFSATVAYPRDDLSGESGPGANNRLPGGEFSHQQFVLEQVKNGRGFVDVQSIVHFALLRDNRPSPSPDLPRIPGPEMRATTGRGGERRAAILVK